MIWLESFAALSALISLAMAANAYFIYRKDNI